MERIEIGKILRPHGLKGEVKILPITDDPLRFEKLKKVYIKELKESYEIENIKFSNDLVIIKFKNINSIDEVKKIQGLYIEIEKKDRVELPKDRYFITDLLNCKVVKEDDTHVGYIEDVYTEYANDIFLIKIDSGKTFMIPIVDEFIKNIDITNKKITISLIEGLIDEN